MQKIQVHLTTGKMTQYNVKGRYTDDRGRSHNFMIESDLADRRFIEQLVRARYPADKVFINTVNQSRG